MSTLPFNSFWVSLTAPNSDPNNGKRQFEEEIQDINPDDLIEKNEDTSTKSIASQLPETLEY